MSLEAVIRARTELARQALHNATHETTDSAVAGGRLAEVVKACAEPLAMFGTIVALATSDKERAVVKWAAITLGSQDAAIWPAHHRSST